MSHTNASDAKTDLAPPEIWEVMLDNSTIQFRKLLALQPEWLPDAKRIFTIVCPKSHRSKP